MEVLKKVTKYSNDVLYFVIVLRECIGTIPGGTGGMVPPNLEGWDIVACIPPQNCRNLAGMSSPPIINAELRHCVSANVTILMFTCKH